VGEQKRMNHQISNTTGLIKESNVGLKTGGDVLFGTSPCGIVPVSLGSEKEPGKEEDCQSNLLEEESES